MKSCPLVVVLGPTGSGKSALAVELATRYNGEIVNCDSVQVYRGFDVGAAKLTVEQRRGIKHHLIDVAGPHEDVTAGDYSRLARAALAEIAARGSLPLVCGGTGFYLRALLAGLSPAPQRCSILRTRLERVAGRRPLTLYRMLATRDPEAARRIHPNDHPKLIRAIEMGVLAGTTASNLQSQTRDALSGFGVLKIGLRPDRGALYDSLNRRTVSVFERGLLKETQVLLAAGYRPDSQAMQSLGYRQAQQVLAGELSFEQAVKECQTRTRQYAKRQLTWFRAEDDVTWLSDFGTSPSVLENASEIVARFLLRQNADQ